MSADYPRWDAVLYDGTRIKIATRVGPSRHTWAARALVDGAKEALGGSVTGSVHAAVGWLLESGHDVRDLVPEGQPSRAELGREVNRLTRLLEELGVEWRVPA